MSTPPGAESPCVPASRGWDTALKRLSLAVVLALACRSNTEPLTGRIYILTSIAGQVLPAPYASNPDFNGLAIADTLALRDGGRGERRFVHEGDTPGSRVSERAELTWSQSGSQVTITLDCPPGAMCIAGPHLVGTIGNGTLTITESLVTRQPLVYSYLYPPD